MQNRVISSLVKITLLTTLASSSLLSDALTLYRLHGIQDLEKQMDYDLSQKQYWSSYLEDIDTSFGYLESYSNVLTCNKSLSTLTLHMKDKENDFEIIKEYSAYTGKISVDKVHEGDLKTPVGVYTLTKKLEKVDSFYGPLAFVTSYPNSYDKYKGKDGSGIWIHGLPIKQERNKFTKGCIAINNQNIECLDRHIDIKKTLLIIQEEGKEREPSKESLVSVLSGLYAWRYAWLYNNTTDYLNFYDEKFVRFDGMDIERFKSYKTRVFNKGESKSIIFNNINVVPYPGEENVFRVTFFEIYKSNSFAFSGDKVLILKLVNNKIKIITEK